MLKWGCESIKVAFTSAREARITSYASAVLGDALVHLTHTPQYLFFYHRKGIDTETSLFQVDGSLVVLNSQDVIGDVGAGSSGN